MNLFTNSMLGIDLHTGELEWYFQTLHHDIWDWDLASGPILFDVTVDGRPVKGVASLGKTCYVYMLDRETGEPIHPVVETVVPTNTDVPGEEPWPTQPVPYNATGVSQEPFCSTYPMVDDPRAGRPRAGDVPPLPGERIRHHRAWQHGRRQLRLTVVQSAHGLAVRHGQERRLLHQGEGGRRHHGSRDRATWAHFGNIAEAGQTGVTPTSTLAAYDPATGQQVWYAESPGATNGGNLVTAGDVVFQGGGDGNFYGFDARIGERLFTHKAETGIHASPLSYQVNGTQYVAIAATNRVLVFGLP